MRRFRHCTVALALALAAARGSSAQQAVTPAVGEASYVIFLNGRETGREQVNVSRTASGWTITSTGTLGPPLNLTNNRFEITYAPDGQPIEMKIAARGGDRPFTVSTSFGTTTAINEITQNGVTNTKTDQITARTVVLPNHFYASFEALAIRLAGTAPGAEIPLYVPIDGEVRALVKDVTPSTYQTPEGAVAVRQFTLAIQNPKNPLTVRITVDDRHRFAKLEIGDGTLTVTRSNLAGVATRQQTFRNPTDSDVRIPAAGFSLVGTLTTPQAQGQLKHPAIVLVAGGGSADRDGDVGGVPLFARLAGDLSNLGYTVLRYDKRGVGQSGGRTETVTLDTYAEDAIAAVKWLAKRKDVDKRRISVFGHGEGASIAMIAAAREKNIAGLIVSGGTGTTGRERIMEQVQQGLDARNAPEAERTSTIELQKKVMDAATTAKGWEELPPETRRAADTPWFRSLLTFDPAKVVQRVKQPILIVQGAVDAATPEHHAQRLAELAKARKDSPPTEVKTLAADTATNTQALAKVFADWLAPIAR